MRIEARIAPVNVRIGNVVVLVCQRECPSRRRENLRAGAYLYGEIELRRVPAKDGIGKVQEPAATREEGLYPSCRKQIELNADRAEACAVRVPPSARQRFPYQRQRHYFGKIPKSDSVIGKESTAISDLGQPEAGVLSKAEGVAIRKRAASPDPNFIPQCLLGRYHSRHEHHG